MDSGDVSSIHNNASIDDGYLRTEITEPSYAERRSPSAIDKYAFQLSALLKTEAAKSRKQRRTLKQIHEDLKELGFAGSYDRVAAFARVWRAGQTDRVNSARKRTIKDGSFTKGQAIPAFSYSNNLPTFNDPSRYRREPDRFQAVTETLR
ncbi:hypothetical protein GN109_12310 [Collimonas pratensis]|uniref:hypothetical protein n=1 Tax=Collimonas pratensis TaxID=279113 RepID=UPI00143CFA62|nr:hypothetical protein [Collimonas pratensis]